MVDPHHRSIDADERGEPAGEHKTGAAANKGEKKTNLVRTTRYYLERRIREQWVNPVHPSYKTGILPTGIFVSVKLRFFVVVVVNSRRSIIPYSFTAKSRLEGRFISHRKTAPEHRRRAFRRERKHFFPHCCGLPSNVEHVTNVCLYLARAPYLAPKEHAILMTGQRGGNSPAF